jgi:hypothetical protein
MESNKSRLTSPKSKDAGFVHESFRNKTNRVILDFWPYETNPRNESFENCVTKRIPETNLLKTDESNRNESMDLQNESTFLRISYTIPAS